MLKKICELIWPRLEGDASTYSHRIESLDIQDEEILQKGVDFALAMYQQQKDRVSTIESKSMVFIGFFGAVIAIISFVIKDVLFVADKGSIELLSLIYLSVLVIYILQVMRYSVRALERRSYQSLNEDIFLQDSNEKIIINMLNTIKGNYDVINLKVDYMVMAQEFTKRVIWVLLLSMIGLIGYAAFELSQGIIIINWKALPFELNLSLTHFVIFNLILICIFLNRKVKQIEERINRD